MSENSPLVTVGIALYNGAQYIIETLNSINRQTYTNIEIVVVDDGSKDNSIEVCNKWAINSRSPIRILKNISNLGLPATRNVLLSNATGKYVSFFDQDDLMAPDRIKDDIDFFEKQNENVAFIFSKVKLINDKAELLDRDYFERINFKGFLVKDIFIELTKMNFISAPTVVLRTDILKKSGGYDETLQFDDWDMWLRLVKNYSASFLDCFNTYYRIHDTSMMSNRNVSQTIIRNRDNIRMLKKHLGFKKDYDVAIYQKLRELSIYSYFIGDDNSNNILQDYLKVKFNIKIWLYHKLANLGIKHHSTIRKGIIEGIKRK